MPSGDVTEGTVVTEEPAKVREIATPAEAWNDQTVLELSCSLLGRHWSQLLLLGLQV